jgi:phosphoribulokinase
MQTSRIELNSRNAPEILEALVARLCADAVPPSDESIIVDCQELSSLDYPVLKNILMLRGKCIFTGTHKLEACMQRYGISSLSDQLSPYKPS